MKKNYQGKYQGAICGDAGSYDVFQTAEGVTLGYKWGSEGVEPEYTGTESGLRELAKAKTYTRGAF